MTWRCLRHDPMRLIHCRLLLVTSVSVALCIFSAIFDQFQDAVVSRTINEETERLHKLVLSDTVRSINKIQPAVLQHSRPCPRAFLSVVNEILSALPMFL